MATLKDLEQLDLSKIDNPKLKGQVEEVIQGYQEASDKEDYLEVFQPNIDKIYEFVKKFAPKAMGQSAEADCECDDELEQPKAVKQKKTSSKGKSTKSKKKPKQEPKASSTAKTTKKDLEKLEEEIKMCRVKIKKYNEKKREGAPKKKPPTRYEKIKGHFIALENLIPEKLKNNIEVQKKSKRLMQNTHRKLLDIYKMTALEGKKDNQELQERLDKVEEKLEA